MPRTIIVSNRLPVKVVKKGGSLVYTPSEGGLATGLGSVYRKGDNLWIGWPGASVATEEEKMSVAEHLRRDNMSPVFLSKKEIEKYYEGFSNSTLWPLFHYFSQYAVYDQRYWESYVQVNQRFGEEILKHASPGDTIWIHDYQLLLLPQILRSHLPDSSIGFFQHIPFPSFELFRLLPWRCELLKGMLGADLIGFHTYDDMRHFLSSVNRIVGMSSQQGTIKAGNRLVTVDAFPMGIDYEKFSIAGKSASVQKREKKYRSELRVEKIILSIDRLDYSKGISQRLKAFRLFLENHPKFRENVVLIMQVVPSRDKVKQYRELKEEVDELVGAINSTYRTISWTPIHYFYRSFPFETIVSLYRMADVVLVTPMRDGMNLVCKEYVASRHDRGGVLILSEMAGAAMELSDALQINPNDSAQMAEAIYTALTMPDAEQRQHMAVMQEMVKRYNVNHWVDVFMDRLASVHKKHAFTATWLDSYRIKAIQQQYEAARQRLIFLDYDGTLVPFCDEPELAEPDDHLLAILRALCSDKRNRVVVISGRDRATLQQWLGCLNSDIIAEHGLWRRENGGDWESIPSLRNDWKDVVRPVLDAYVGRTPGSMIEEKEYALVWHYRKVKAGLGEMRAHELTSHLGYLAGNMQLQILEGDKVVEVKNPEANKGTAVMEWLGKYSPDFILAIGDDRTDEDIFGVLPGEAITIKVGNARSLAQYNILSHSDVRALLAQLVRSNVVAGMA